MSAQCNLSIRRDDCTLETCCLEQGFINYQPTLAGNYIYLACLAVILAAQTALFLINRKTWGFYTAMACGLVLEIVGYIGRILLHDNPFSLNNFVIYLVCLTIGPAFLMAAIYLLFGRVVVAYGSHHGLIRPVYYSAICITGDLISLVLQALGGALAATGAKGAGDHGHTQTGTHIMVAGLAFQLFSTAIFVILAGFFFNSVLRNKTKRNLAFVDVTSHWRFKGLIAAIALATLTILIRSAFRVDELQGGFSSDVANNETLLMVFEGPMIIIATLALTIFSPGWSFQSKYGQANWTAGKKSTSSEESSQSDLATTSIEMSHRKA